MMSSLIPSPSAARPRRRQLSIRTRLIGAFVGVVLLAILGFGAASVLVSGNALLAVVGNQLDARADEQATIIAQYLDQQITSLRVLALNQTLVSGIRAAALQYPAEQEAIARHLAGFDADWRTAPPGSTLVDSRVSASPVAAALRDYRRLAPANVELLVADAFGGLVAATARTSDFDQSDEAWWQSARAGAVYLGQPELDESTGVHALLIAVPVVSPADGAVIGVARSTFRFDALAAQIAAVRVGATGGALLLLPDGRSVGRDGRAAALSSATRELFAAADTRSYVSGPLDGRARLLSIAPLTLTPEISALGWRLVFYQDDFEAMAPLMAARVPQLVAAVVALIGAAVLAALVSSRIGAPLSRLAIVAQAIADGDLSQRAGLDGDDEIGRLARSFDTMSAALEQRIGSEQAAQAERARLQDEVIRVQRDTLKALATPLIPLNAEVLLLPLVGLVDDERAEQIFQALLQGIARCRAQRVIIDLSGIPTLDAAVAETLIRAAHGARLLGAEVVLTGISAALALTLTQLAIPLGRIKVVADLESALAHTRLV